MVSIEISSTIAIILGILCGLGVTIIITNLIVKAHSTLGRDEVTAEDFNAQIDTQFADPQFIVPWF